MQATGDVPPDDIDGRSCDPIAALWSGACEACRAAGVPEVSVARYADRQLASVLFASSERAAALEQLQDTLGEGPSITALTERGPILLSDIRTERGLPWVTFVAEATTMGVGSMWTVPLMVGAVDIGVLTVHGPRPARFTNDAWSQVVRLADAIVVALLTPDPPVAAEPEELLALAPGSQFITHQAMGMVMVQQNGTLADALATMRASAFASGTTLRDVAEKVVARELHFGNRSDDEGSSRPEEPRRGSGDEERP